MFVNADGVSAGAPLKIELLNEKLKVIGSASVAESGTRVEAMTLPKGRIAVRISFAGGSAARLYAIYISR